MGVGVGVCGLLVVTGVGKIRVVKSSGVHPPRRVTVRGLGHD
jgi:hypothetical protein